MASRREMITHEPRNTNRRSNISPQERLEHIARVLVKAIYLQASDCEADHTNGPENVVGDVTNICSQRAAINILSPLETDRSPAESSDDKVAGLYHGE